MKPKSFTNTIVITLSVLLITSLTTVVSCNKSDKKETWHLPDEINMPATLNLSDPIKEATGKRVDGSATIYQTNNGEILISYISNQVQRNFILQTNNKRSDFAGIKKIPNAELIFMMDFVLVNDLDKGQLIIYSVKAQNYNEIFANVPEFVKDKISEIKDGYGLAFYNQTWTTLNENISLEGSIYSALGSHTHTDTQKTIDNPGGSGCSAGGPGSASCSVSGCIGSPTSCNVSCQSGYYSCCKCDPLIYATCFCTPN